MKIERMQIHFFSDVFSAVAVLTTGNVLRGVTSATHWQKFHTYVTHKVNVCKLKIWFSPCSILHFPWLILENCCVQQISNTSSREEYIPQILTVFVIDSSCLHLTCLSFVNNSWNHIKYNYSIVQSALMTGQILHYHYGIFVAKSQKFFLAICPPVAMSKEKCMCPQASRQLNS